MKRSKMIEKLVKIYQSRPKGCGDYHIVDILLGAAEREGMLPPTSTYCYLTDNCGTKHPIGKGNVWEEEEDVEDD